MSNYGWNKNNLFTINLIFNYTNFTRTKFVHAIQPCTLLRTTDSAFTSLFFSQNIIYSKENNDLPTEYLDENQ